MEGRPGRGVSSARCAGGGAGDQATAAQLRGELRPCCPESCPLLLESPPAPRCCLVGPCRPDPARHPAPAGPRPPPPSTRPPQYGQALLAAGGRAPGSMHAAARPSLHYTRTCWNPGHTPAHPPHLHPTQPAPTSSTREATTQTLDNVQHLLCHHHLPRTPHLLRSFTFFPNLKVQVGCSQAAIWQCIRVFMWRCGGTDQGKGCKISIKILSGTSPT